MGHILRAGILCSFYLDFNEEDWVYEDAELGDVQIFPIWGIDAREENKLVLGYHVFGGLMIPFARRITLDVQFKYNKAEGEFKDSFEGFEPFDLGGYQISLGINYWF